jgi:hypothetical protein
MGDEDLAKEFDRRVRFLLWRDGKVKFTAKYHYLQVDLEDVTISAKADHKFQAVEILAFYKNKPAYIWTCGGSKPACTLEVVKEALPVLRKAMILEDMANV